MDGGDPRIGIGRAILGARPHVAVHPVPVMLGVNRG